MKKTLIERIELASAASSITFTSIPQDYTDLYLKVSLRTTRTTTTSNFIVGFNGTGSISRRVLSGSGSAASSDTSAYTGLVAGANSTINVFSSSGVYIPNYTSSNQKTFSVDSVSENNATEAFQQIMGVIWSESAAITSLTITEQLGSDFSSYSSASLYGVTSGSDGTTTVS
jgi:hypothetical protein